MRHSKTTVLIIVFLVTVTTTLAPVARAQSGRGRPRTSTREPSAPPPPVKVPEPVSIVTQEQFVNTSRFVLKNGMTVVISEQHAAPVTALVAAFKVGRAQEPDGQAGVAELLERTIGRGTPARWLADMRTLGAAPGSFTTADSTFFYFTAPSDKFNEALKLHAGQLQNSALDAAEIARQAARPERRAAETSNPFGDEPDAEDPATAALARLHEMAFAGRKTGFGIAPGAAPAALTREQLEAFYRASYRPENLVIAVAGDVLAFPTLLEIQKLFVNFGAPPTEPAGKTAAKPAQTADRKAAPPANDQKNDQKNVQQAPMAEPAGPKPETPPDALRYAAERGPVSQSVVSVGFRVPGAGAAEWAALEVLTALAGQGRAARLRRSLVDQQALLSRVEADYSSSKDGGMLVFQMWLAPASSIDRAESGLFRELDRLRRELVSAGELARARAWLEKRFLDQTENYLGRALHMARAETLGAGLDFAIKYRDRVRAVRAEDVQRAAARYLTLANTTIHEMEPASAPERTFDSESFAKTVLAWAPGFDAAVAEVRPADPETAVAALPQGEPRSAEQQAAMESIQPLAVRDFSTYNGPRAFVREDHTVAKTTVALLFQGGRVLEDEGNEGITELMLRSILGGSARRTADELAQELEQLGADVEIVNEPDFFGFMLSVLSRNADRALRALRQAIEEPAFRDADIASARRQQIGAIHRNRDAAFERARTLLYQSLFPAHPYGFAPHGREEVLAKLNAEQLRAWHEKSVKRQLPLAIIVGDTDGSALVSANIADGFRRRETDPSIKVRVPQAVKPQEKVESRGGRQTAVAIGMPGPKGGSTDAAALAVIEAAMNGAGGRLLDELREKQPLVARARLGHEAMYTAGVVYARLVTTAAGEAAARAALVAQLEKLARGGLGEEELQAARRLAAASRVLRLQSQKELAMAYARALIYQQKAEEVEGFAEKLSKVTAEEVKRAAAQYFNPAAAGAGVVR